MYGRTSDSQHKRAQELLKKPGTVVRYQEIDLGTATTRSQREHILRHYEQMEMDRLTKEGKTLTNARRAEARSKSARNAAEVKEHGAKPRGPQKTC